MIWQRIKQLLAIKPIHERFGFREEPVHRFCTMILIFYNICLTATRFRLKEATWLSTLS